MGVDRDEAKSLICKKGLMETLLALKQQDAMYKEELAVASGLSSAWVDRQLKELEHLNVVDSYIEGRKKYFILTDTGKEAVKVISTVDKNITKLQDILTG